MKRNGFTLIEVLAVIMVVAVVSLVAMPAIQKNINDSKQQAYNTQIDMIIKAAKDWSSENLMDLPENNGDKINITLYSLISLGYISNDLVDPLTDKYFDKETAVSITRKNNNYKYDVEVKFSDEEIPVDHNAPILILKGDYITYLEIGEDSFSEPGISSNGFDLDLNDISIIYYLVENIGEKEDDNNRVEEIDYNNIGKYKIEYVVTNDGKSATIARYVIIRDTKAPVITLPITTEILSTDVNSFELMDGVNVTDNSGESITPEVVGQLSTIPGEYVITYIATDSSGNKKIKKRTIVVK